MADDMAGANAGLNDMLAGMGLGGALDPAKM